MQVLREFASLIAADPLKAAILFFCLGVITFLALIVRIFARKFENVIARQIANRSLAHFFDRVAVLTFAIHATISLLTAMTCYAFSNYPAPAFDPNLQHPQGPHVLRFIGYGMGVIIPLLGLVGVLSNATLPRKQDSLHLMTNLWARLPVAIGVGTPLAILFISYGFLFDPTLLGLDRYPDEARSSLIWWYCWMAIPSFSFGVVALASAYGVSRLWRWTKHLSAPRSWE